MCEYLKLNLSVNFEPHDTNSATSTEADGEIEHSLDDLAADVEPVDGLPSLDVLEHADPLVCDGLQVGVIARDDRGRSRGGGLGLGLPLGVLSGSGALTHPVGGGEVVQEAAGGMERRRGKEAGCALPDEREASPEAN